MNQDPLSRGTGERERERERVILKEEGQRVPSFPRSSNTSTTTTIIRNTFSIC
jgi:hypothetical protein